MEKFLYVLGSGALFVVMLVLLALLLGWAFTTIFDAVPEIVVNMEEALEAERTSR